MGFDPEIIQLGVNPEIIQLGVNLEIIQLGVNPEIMGVNPEIIQLGVNPEIMGVNPEIIQLGVNPEITSNRHLTPHHLLFPIVSLLNLILLFYSAPSLWSYRITFLYWTNSSLSMCFISIAFVTRYFTVDYFRWVFCCWSSASVFQYFIRWLSVIDQFYISDFFL